MKIKKKDLNPPDTDILENSKTVSSTECTGLIQSIPENDFEEKSYEDLFQTQTNIKKNK